MTNENIKALNDGLKELCETKGANFVDNRASFTLSDGSVNDGYILDDGVDLNRQGTNRLASNLELVKKTNVKDVTKSKQMPRKPNNQKLQSSQTRNGPGYRSPGQRPLDPRPHSRSSHEVNTRTAEDREWMTVSSRNRWPRQPTVNPRNSTPVPGNIPDRNDGYACFNYGENNHNVDTCRWGGPVTCHLCRRTGHKQNILPQLSWLSCPCWKLLLGPRPWSQCRIGCM